MPTESKDLLTNFANSLNPDQTSKMLDLIVCSFALIFDVPVNNFSVMYYKGHFPVFLGLTSTKQTIICLANAHNTVPLVTATSHEPMTFRPHV